MLYYNLFVFEKMSPVCHMIYVSPYLLLILQTSGPDTTDSWYSEHHVTEETMAKVDLKQRAGVSKCSKAANVYKFLGFLMIIIGEALNFLFDLLQLQAMKMLVRWLEGLQSNANNSGTSTLRLLYTVIIHEGDLMEKGMIK